MRLDAIMFDLDGTLLPMELETFVRAYFGGLCRELAPLGIVPEALTKALWTGTTAMMKNDGSMLNEEVFWTHFSELTGMSREALEPRCAHFYANGFHAARAATGENPLAREAVQAAREKADKVILATNPLFPMEAQQARLSWIGLTPEDFDLVTHYSSDRFCKPNPAYYADICRKMQLKPENCLMIGNDDREDMWAATSLGMEGYLITDCRIPLAEKPWQGPQGTFRDMLQMLKTR